MVAFGVVLYPLLGVPMLRFGPGLCMWCFNFGLLSWVSSSARGFPLLLFAACPEVFLLARPCLLCVYEVLFAVLTTPVLGYLPWFLQYLHFGFRFCFPFLCLSSKTMVLVLGWFGCALHFH